MKFENIRREMKEFRGIEQARFRHVVAVRHNRTDVLKGARKECWRKEVNWGNPSEEVVIGGWETTPDMQLEIKLHELEIEELQEPCPTWKCKRSYPAMCRHARKIYDDV